MIALALLTACASSGPSKKQLEAERIKRLSHTYAEKGAGYLAEGNIKVALHDLKKSIELDPNNAEAHGTLGILYERLGKLDEAERHYLRAAKLKPDDPRIINNYGRFLCTKGDYAAGIKLLQQAAADPLYDNPWVAMTNAGECALEAGDSAKGEAFLRQALKLNPNFAPALAAMVALSVRQGNYLSARAFLERYKAVAKPTAELLRLGHRIESQLGDEAAAKHYQEQLRRRFPNEP